MHWTYLDLIIILITAGIFTCIDVHWGMGGAGLAILILNFIKIVNLGDY